MAYWLLKTDPKKQSYDELEHFGQLNWSVPYSKTVMENLRHIQVEDEMLIYHAGIEQAIVGIAEIAGVSELNGHDNNVILITPKGRLKRPISLFELQINPQFSASPFLTQLKAPIVSIPTQIWNKVIELSLG